MALELILIVKSEVLIVWLEGIIRELKLIKNEKNIRFFTVYHNIHKRTYNIDQSR